MADRAMAESGIVNTDVVIVRAGKNSVHRNWMQGQPAYDLIVFAYEELPPELTSMATAAITLAGPKIYSWDQLFSQRPEILQNYRQIALLDDDLICTAADINASFAAGARYQLDLWQPSLSWDSYFSYAVALHNPLFRLRYVNFIELMCPFFSAAHLRLALPLFALGFETTVDRLWCRLQPDGRYAYAIIDAVQFRHSRPVGQNAAAQGFLKDATRRDGNMYQAVIDRTESELNLFFRGPVAYAGITRKGTRVGGRVVMAAMSLVLFLARRRRVNKLFFVPVSNHIRHILTRPIDNEPINTALLPRSQHAAPAAEARLEGN